MTDFAHTKAILENADLGFDMALEIANDLVAEVERLRGVMDRVQEATTTARHALHLTGTLDPREVLHHITTAMEAE